jgi:hypothetical protein
MDARLMAVLRKRGRVVWHHVQLPFLNDVGATGTYVLSRHQGTKWMHDEPTLTGGWFDYLGGESLASTTLLSTAAVHASLLLERTEPTAPQESRRRYYRYLIARVADGRVFLAGPDKDIAQGHHRAERPVCLDDLYSASTSTG